MNRQHLSDTLFARYRRLVYAESGINLTEAKRELLQARLSRRLRVCDLSAEAYLELIQHDSTERSNFIDAISTNYSYFFREAQKFKYLDGGVERIWCAGSASGEEPYSLAIYCLRRGMRPDIRATDISSTCLRRARQGIYPVESASYISKSALHSSFQKGTGRFEGMIRIKKHIRALVTFGYFNLIRDPPPEGFDVVFCRNVMIYFDRPTKELVARKLVRSLKPGGYLIIGGAESLSGIDLNLQYLEPSAYRKIIDS